MLRPKEVVQLWVDDSITMMWKQLQLFIMKMRQITK